MRKQWTFSECLKIFKKYKTIKDIRNSPEHHRVYVAAKKFKWLDKCKAHMQPLRKSYTYKICKDIALKCEYLNDFYKYNNGSIYQWTFQNGYFDEFTSHLKRKKIKDGTYTKQYLLELFKQFDKIQDLVDLHNGAYQTAIKKGWIKECTAHMSGFGNSSSKEEQLLEIVKTKYPSATSKWFGKYKKGEYAKRFQLDIYIPELNKAVEFNGTYFHSYENLKRSRPNWTDDMVRDYHNIKKSFFNNLSIEYIEIWEDSWKQDKNSCIKRVFEFLG